MQTQGISFATPDMSGKVSTKKSKPSDNSFNSLIANRSAKTSDGELDAVRPVGVKGRPTSDKFKDVSSKTKSSAKSDTTRSKSTKSGSIKEVTEETTQEVTTVVMVVFQTNFQMSEEDVRDLMNQAGIAIEDFAQAIQDGVLNGEGMEMLQNLVMKFHGITDKAAVLTEDSLTSEIGSMAGQISEMLTDAAERLADSEGQEDMLSSESAVSQLDVIVEKEMESGSQDSGDMTGQSGMLNQREDRDVHSIEHTAGEQFVQNLSQVYEQSEVEEVSSTQQTMSRIVEQVVTQVRIRVMASTTSMELQLHPASLGRVNLQVATAAGVSTALLTVESQAAKEALESQLIRLKQTFEEQGLKVNEVEVTVSEFGLGEHNREAGQEQQNSQGGNRRFQFEEDESESFGSEEELRETVSEKRDSNSTVDYTA